MEEEEVVLILCMDRCRDEAEEFIMGNVTLSMKWLSSSLFFLLQYALYQEYQSLTHPLFYSQLLQKINYLQSFYNQ